MLIESNDQPVETAVSNALDIPTEGKKVDPRIIRTKQLLSQALKQLVGERCFKDITVQDILERSTVNRATFYDHFEDKNSLLQYVLSDLFERTVNKRLPHNAAPSAHNLDLLLLGICDFFSNMRRCPRLKNVQTNPSIDRSIRPHVQTLLGNWFHAYATAGGDAGFDAELKTAVASAAICGAAIQWNRSETIIPAEDFTAKLTVLLEPTFAHLFEVHRGSGRPDSAPAPRESKTCMLELPDPATSGAE